MSREPEQLRRGKQFHKLIQREWVEEAEGSVHPERTIHLLNGRRGRVDILVDDVGDRQLVVIEVKATDWDHIKSANIRRNINRQIRQIWKYVESRVELKNLIVTTGVIFPRAPDDLALRNMIEGMFEDNGITVVWHDEAIEVVRDRNRMKHRNEHEEECHVLEGPDSNE